MTCSRALNEAAFGLSFASVFAPVPCHRTVALASRPLPGAGGAAPNLSVALTLCPKPPSTMMASIRRPVLSVKRVLVAPPPGPA